MFRKGLALLCSLLCITALADEKYQFSSEQQRIDFIQLNEELRCPKCQNQNIADSNALIATDMKRKVYELLQQGKSKEEIVQFMKVRYGDFVSYDPPMTPLTFFLYFGPALFISVTISYLIYSSRRGRKVSAATSTESDQRQVDSKGNPDKNKNDDFSSKLAKAEKALKDLE